MNSLIPAPCQIVNQKETFKIPNIVSVDATGFSSNRRCLLNALEPFISVKDGDDEAHIRFLLNPAMEEEEYRLEVKKATIDIMAATFKGAHYGIQTLGQLLADQEYVECCLIEDKPLFKWRGVHLDVSRHYFPVEFIKKFLDIIALYKMNVFHWHLTDDQGWRLQLKSFPELTVKGSSRKEKDGSIYRGFYTQEDVREVVEYASSRGIEVVPEIEMPGHASSVVATYPKLSCKQKPICVPNEWGIFKEVYCAGRESTFEFLENVLDEVISLFPSQYIHIGGDECPKDSWKTCPACQERIKNERLDGEDELQSWFIKRMVNFLKSRGKTAIGWDEILEGGLAEDAVVMSWQGYHGGIKAVKNGNKAIMTPTSHCYFDYYQAKEGEPKAFEAFLPLDKVYGFEPIPEGLETNETKLILGGQANLWTEYMPNGDQVEYMLLPRLAAMSEVLWSQKEKKDYDGFLNRLAKHTTLWDKRHYNYRKLG